MSNLILEITMTPQRQEELQSVIDSMKKLSEAFYFSAIRIGNHAFIEFVGLQTEYIKICEQSLNNGIDFTTANTHGEGRLKVYEYNTEYLQEKLNCIFDNCYSITLEPLESPTLSKDDVNNPT